MAASEFAAHVFSKEKDKLDLYLNAILRLEKECFPNSWQYENAEEKYKKNLESLSDINVFLLEGGSNIVGYALAVPQNRVVEELSPYDKDFVPNEECYYIETVEISPDIQGRGGLRPLINSTISAIREAGGKEVSIHARILNHFDQKIQNLMLDDGVKCLVSRKLEHWFFGGNEPYNYIQWSI